MNLGGGGGPEVVYSKNAVWGYVAFAPIYYFINIVLGNEKVLGPVPLKRLQCERRSY